MQMLAGGGMITISGNKNAPRTGDGPPSLLREAKKNHLAFMKFANKLHVTKSSSQLSILIFFFPLFPFDLSSLSLSFNSLDNSFILSS